MRTNQSLITGLTFATLSVLGCATAHLTAFRDPAYSSASFSQLAVFGVGMELAASVEVERQFCERVAPTRCVRGKVVLPPTRTYTAQEVNDALGRAGVDGVLIVGLVSDEGSTQYVGTTTSVSTQSSGTTNGMANLYGNSAYWSSTTSTQASTSTVSTPQYVYNRTAVARVGLYDRRLGNLAWTGELKVTGQGIFAGDGSFIRSAAKKVGETLRAEHLVR